MRLPRTPERYLLFETFMKPFDEKLEVLSDVPETVRVTAMRLRELTETGFLNEAIAEQDLPEVTHAKIIPLRSESTPTVPEKPAGYSVTAVGEAQRAVEEALRAA